MKAATQARIWFIVTVLLVNSCNNKNLDKKNNSSQFISSDVQMGILHPSEGSVSEWDSRGPNVSTRRTPDTSLGSSPNTDGTWQLRCVNRAEHRRQMTQKKAFQVSLHSTQRNWAVLLNRSDRKLLSCFSTSRAQPTTDHTLQWQR